MGEKVIEAVVAIATAIVGIAILSVLVSKQANTAQVVQAGGSAFASDIEAAVSPVTGGGFNLGGGASLPIQL